MPKLIRRTPLMTENANLAKHDDSLVVIHDATEVVPADRRMADLALAFNLEMAQADHGRWSIGSTLGFAISVSAALWLIIGVIAVRLF